jgi:hypothetical protein
MKFKKIITVLILYITIFNCNAQNKISKNDLKEFCKNLVGTYSNVLQSKKDKMFDKKSLSITPIWQNKKNEFWFIEEQSNFENINKNNTKLIFRIFKMNDSVIVKQIYTIKKSKQFNLNSKSDNYIKNITTNDIILRAGCALFFSKKNSIYYGRTHDTDCPSYTNGAQFESRNETITSNSIFILNQGFDSNGKQVWGNTKGEFKFYKK